jgi:hypothetical protein
MSSLLVAGAASYLRRPCLMPGRPTWLSGLASGETSRRPPAETKETHAGSRTAVLYLLQVTNMKVGQHSARLTTGRRFATELLFGSGPEFFGHCGYRFGPAIQSCGGVLK